MKRQLPDMIENEPAHNGLIRPPACDTLRSAVSQMMKNGAVTENLVLCTNSQGVEIRASLQRLTRYRAVIEI